MSNKKKMSQTKKNLIIDLAAAVTFFVAMAPQMTGFALHEWISFALGATLMVHLVVHWKWVVATTTRFFGKVSRQARINYILNWVLLIWTTIVMVTGILISETLLPLLGLSGSVNPFWSTLHHTASDAIILVMALHIALHWKWIVNAVKRYIVQPLRRQPAAGKVQPAKLVQKKVNI
jgi:hypothetical protein